MRGKRLALAAAALLCLAVSGDTEGGIFRKGPARQRTTLRYSSLTRASPGCTATRVSTVAVAGDESGAFLAALNAWRGQHGRGPVGWDPGLAASAATNNAVHAPGSSGGAAQCWAPTGSLSQALAM